MVLLLGNNCDAIVNYHRRYHDKRPVSTSRAEGCVDEIANARIVPLESNALRLRYGLLRPGPDYVLQRFKQEAAQTEMLDPPSVLERRLGQRTGEMVARQAVEDEGRGAGAARRGVVSPLQRHPQTPYRQQCARRDEPSLAELEAAVSWLERNRLADHAGAREGNPRYDWPQRQRREWTPPIGRTDGRPQGAPKLAARPTRHTS